MNCTASIEIQGDKNTIKAFEPEQNHLKNDRSSYKIKQKINKIIFNIRAKDLVALRATINTILRLAQVYQNGHSTSNSGKNSKTSTL